MGPHSSWAFLMYWSPLGSHSAASRLHSSLTSAPELLSYYSPCCHLVGKLPSLTPVCLLDQGAQLGEASVGPEGHQGGQSAPNAPFQQVNYFLLSPFLLLPAKMAYLHTYQVFLRYQGVFTGLSCVLNEIPIIISILPLLRKFLCLLLLCLMAVIFLIWEFLINLA